MTAPTIAYGDEPQVIVCADSEEGAARCAASVAAAGGRIGSVLDMAGAAERLGALPPPDAMLVEIRRDGGGALDRLLDRLNIAAGDGHHPSVVNLVPELIDVAAARAGHGDVTLLCRADPIELTAALGVALAARPQHLLRERGEEPPVQLRQLSEEVGRIARALAQLSGGEAAADAAPRLPLPDLPRGALPAVATLRALIRARRLREQYFEAELFADPAWDMLLDLTAARAERSRVSVTSLCIASGVPPTTALRWIAQMTEAGLLQIDRHLPVFFEPQHVSARYT